MEPLTVLVEKSIKRNVLKTRKTVLVMMAEVDNGIFWTKPKFLTETGLPRKKFGMSLA